MKKIKEFIKQFFCPHTFIIDRWHLTHGKFDNEPMYIDGFEKCAYCGKERYFTVERGSKLEDYILKYMLERQR